MILYYSRNFGRGGGASKSAVDVLVDLCATGQPLWVASEDRIDVPAEVDGYRLTPPQWIHTPPPPRRPTARKVSFLWRGPAWLWQLAGEPRVRRGLHAALRRAEPRLIVYNTFTSFGSNHPLSIITAPDTALVVRAAPECFRYYEQADHRRTLEWALREMAQFRNLIFVSSRGRDEWLSFPELREKRSFYIPNCSREDEVARCRRMDRGEVRRRLEIADDDFAMVCIASVQPRKGQDLLVDAFPSLLSAAPNLKLLLVGSTKRQWATELRGRVREMGLEGRILFLGHRPDALEHIYAADALVLPSRSEAMPRTVLEAMALGTPVMAAAVAGVPELIADGESGFLFERDDVAGLIEAFERMIADPDRRGRYAARAEEVYRAEFSRARQIERYRQVTGQMLDDAVSSEYR
jgi:glycosyltransferase involved in cell wall biosynthesis